MPSAGLFLRIGAIFILVGLVVGTFYSASSASTAKVDKQNSSVVSRDKLRTDEASVKMPEHVSPTLRESFHPFLLPVLQSSPESIATYAPDCTTLKTDFDLGDIVCARATAVPVTVFSWHVAWPDTVGFIRQTDTAIADDQVTYLYQLPSTPTSVVNGQTVNNTGTWRVSLTRFSGAIRQIARFTVHQPSNPKADVFVQKFSRGGDEPVGTGGSIPFVLVVGNDGPDTAQNVHLVDSLPSGATLLSFTQQSGPPCTPADNNDCTMASLTNGERAEFTAVYTVGGSAGTFVSSASVSSTTPDPDNSNNSASAQFEISAGSGTPACTLICPTSPAPVNNEPGLNGAHVTFNPPVTSGTCGDVSTSAISGAFFPIGITTVTASTESGETCTFAVTVNDVEDPTVTCPANITTFESSPGSGSATVSFTVTATDNSGTPGNPAGSATVSCDHPSGSSFDVGPETTVRCHATDDASNISTECSFTVTVNPVSAGCTLTPPAPIVVNSDATACGTIVTFDVTPSATGCGTVTCDHPSGSFFPGGETLVTCTSSPDGASTSFTVTVNDTTAPVPDLSTLPTITGDCTANAGIPTVIITPTGPQTVMEPPTATDNCGGRIQAATNDPRTYQDPGTFTVHWTYTDASGNTSSQDQTIVVTGSDTIAPVPDLATLPTVTDECSATVPNPPTATDDCDGTITGTTSDPLTYTGAGTYTVHWTYTDQAGHSVQQNQTVVVTDGEAPTIALVGASSMTVECHTSFFDPGVTTTDNCVPENVTVTTSGSVNIDVPNTYTITYTATDGGGNQASVDRTVIVQDTTKPVITLNAPASVTVECHTSFTDPGATASDTCDTSVPATVSGTVDVNTPGTYALTYNAMDDSGNQADPVQRTVTVVDTIAPTITLNGANPMTVECHTTFTDPGATAHDICSADFPATASGSVNVNVVGSYTITYNASDAAGNNATAVTRTVNVIDTTAPTITLNSYAPSMWPPNHKYTTFQLTQFVTGASDSCNTSLGLTNVVIEKVTSDEIENGGGDGNTMNDIVIAANCKSVQLRSEREGGGNGRVYTITFKVTDASGNDGRATAKVVVPHNPGETPVDSGVHYTVNGNCP